MNRLTLLCLCLSPPSTHTHTHTHTYHTNTKPPQDTPTFSHTALSSQSLSQEHPPTSDSSNEERGTLGRRRRRTQQSPASPGVPSPRGHPQHTLTMPQHLTPSAYLHSPGSAATKVPSPHHRPTPAPHTHNLQRPLDTHLGPVHQLRSVHHPSTD